MAIGGDVAAFRLSDLQEIASNARQADGLRRSRTFIRGRHSIQIEVIYDKEKGGTDQNADKRTHGEIVSLPVAHCNEDRTASCVRKQRAYSPRRARKR